MPPSKILGHTASGKPVLTPTRGSPNTNDILTFRKTKAKFSGWSKADHMDAAKLLELAAEEEARRTGGDSLSRRYHGWSSTHWDIGGRWTSPEFESRFAGASARPAAPSPNESEIEEDIRRLTSPG